VTPHSRLLSGRDTYATKPTHDTASRQCAHCYAENDGKHYFRASSVDERG
jgi:hypothetical protein